jgi:quercetin dioxygenase-like cupin family protein
MTIERILTPHSLDAPLMAFDLVTMIAEMKAEPTWEAANRNAITLLKDHGLRIVLVVMRAGTVIPPHRAEGPITVQVLEGQLSFTAGSREVPLGPGRFLTLAAGAPHGVLAIEDAAFLLTVAAERAHPAEGPHGK